MHNFIVKFGKILDICKQFAGNRVNNKACQGLPNGKSQAMCNNNPDAATAKGYCASQQIYYYGYKLHAVCGISGVMHSYDMTAANVHDIRYLDDAKWEYRNCLMLGDKGYLSAEIRQSLFDVANITLEVPYRLNQKDWRSPSEAYKRFRKRIETVFSQGGFYKFALSKI